MKVYQAVAAVMKDLSAQGIGKDRKNQQQGYNFRGIDDVYNALAPVMSKHGLIALPRVLSRECIERQSSKGSVLFYVTVEVEFDFVSSEDGSKHTVKTYGEAMDSADKATNKAMSAAYKYAAMQAFCIPTEGDNDADATTHQVAAKPAAKLSDSAVAYHLAAIQGSTRDTLRDIYGRAKSAAIEADDHGAAAKFLAAQKAMVAKIIEGAEA
jgi:hypothetical protein